MAYREDTGVYLEDEDLDVLDKAALAEAKHRLCNDLSLMWEALGPDALPREVGTAHNLEQDIATALVSSDYERLGRLMAGMATTYAFGLVYEQIADDWEDYIDADDIRTGGYCG